MTSDLNSFLSTTPVADAWKKIGIYPHHGINLLLSALHTKNSSGIGEFYDLLPLIDWCNEVNLDTLQLLPLNDTGDDPSPYYSISSCALNPLFISLYALPYLKQTDELQKLQLLSREASHLSYSDVQSHKFFFLRHYFHQEGQTLIQSKEFEQFVSQSPWLLPYALFKTIKTIVSKNHWMTWPENLKKLTSLEKENLLKNHGEEIAFFMLLQYLCFSQLAEVKKYAQKKKVHLFGDLPILISPDSADVWHHRELFDLNLQAGSPPDIYSTLGQAWGFPIMRWDMMEKENYSWWKERLLHASNFYDIYRLDHVIGLFRIWAVPLNKTANEGFYIPSNENLWNDQGKKNLMKLVSHSQMLPIAEDLGVVRPSMREVLKSLGICGTKVMRWERKWEEDKSFIPFNEYPPLSLTTVSTHDSETLELWWRDEPEEAKVFAQFKGWQYSPKLTFDQRKEILWDSHHTPSLFHVNLLQEYLSLFPNFDWNSPEEERINVPGKVMPTNWTYRFKPSVEEILQHDDLKKEMKNILDL
ncbi:MAG TPA: 4-alpha-glucanotransferase [Rhabdochlamydiaceae bacterium]|nr:4-alpha-glucanotransferase [Rhabdochlamydiaceae bacterium]